MGDAVEQVVLRVGLATLICVAFMGAAEANVVRYAPNGKSVVLFHEQPSKKGTVILGHGFTGKADNWVAYGKLLHKKGFDVIMPALPGHGLVDKDGRADSSHVPRALESARYEARGEAAYRLARTRKNTVHVVGFSAGGDTVLSIAENHAADKDDAGRPVLGRVIALNAFLQASPKGAKVPVNWRLAQKTFNRIDDLTGGGASKMADQMKLDMDPHHRRTRADRDEYSFRKGTFGNIVALHRLGSKVMRNRDKLTNSNVTIIVSNDDVAHAPTSKKLAKDIGAELIEIAQTGHSILENRGTLHARYPVLKAITQRIEQAP